MGRKIGNLEKQSDDENPNWIPQAGEYYAWRESNTRHGDLIVRRVISYDAKKKVVRGREPSGMSERRYLSGVFRLSENEVDNDIEL